MNRLKDFFKVDLKYKESVLKYGQTDGILALIIYSLVMIFYYAMGIVYARTNLYLGVLINLVLAFVCIAFALIKKQNLESIGFSRKNLKKSIILGVIFGLVVLLVNLIPGLMSGKILNTLPNLLVNLLYYLVIIALVEEIIFRGYIQTRIYGLVKKPILAILLTAFLFMSIHIPFQMYVNHMNFILYISSNYITLVFTFIWHIVLNFLYTKYNSIVAPTIFHTIMNWSNYLFI